MEKALETSNDFKFIATNDLPGAAAGIAQILADRGELTEGSYAAVCMTGGGCGIADIKVKNGQLEIEASEGGHNRALRNPSLSLEQEGASAPALIENFAKELGFSEEEIKALKSTGMAKLVLKRDLKVTKGENGTRSEKEEAILRTGLFEQLEDVVDTDDLGHERTRSVFRLKDVKKKDYKQASISAVNKYIDAISQLTANKVNQGLNLMVLTGPLATRIRDFVADNQDAFDGKTLAELVQSKTASYLDDSGRDMAETYNFKVVCDEQFELKDNTAGGKVLLAGEIIDPEHRGNWIIVPVEALKEKVVRY